MFMSQVEKGALKGALGLCTLYILLPYFSPIYNKEEII